jgi:FdhD protein
MNDIEGEDRRATPAADSDVTRLVRLEGRPVAEPGVRQMRIRRYQQAGADDAVDAIAIEEPLEIRLAWRGDDGPCEKSISITMRTPGNDLELATGFLFTEGIINDPAQIEAIDHCGPPVGPMQLRNVVKVVLADGSSVDLARLERHFYTTSSCGVCGKTSLEALRVQAPAPIHNAGFSIDPAVLCSLPPALRAEQAVFGRTGGIHASALFDSAGRILALREDVGRHNALDKLIGSLFVDGELPLGQFGILVSGRASFELMQKAIMGGAGMLAAVGAPSSLAVELAREYRVTLVGFLRGDRFNVYAGQRHVGSAGADPAPEPFSGSVGN